MAEERTGNNDYDQLPAAVKEMYTLTQYLWLSGDEKGRLVRSECEPETEL